MGGGMSGFPELLVDVSPLSRHSPGMALGASGRAAIDAREVYGMEGGRQWWNG